MWSDRWTLLWCGRRQRGEGWGTNIPVSTTRNSARLWESFGGKNQPWQTFVPIFALKLVCLARPGSQKIKKIWELIEDVMTLSWSQWKVVIFDGTVASLGSIVRVVERGDRFSKIKTCAVKFVTWNPLTQSLRAAFPWKDPSNGIRNQNFRKMSFIGEKKWDNLYLKFHGTFNRWCVNNFA